MDQHSSTDRLGEKADLSLLEQDEWLLNSAVLYQISERKGRFWIIMLYVDYKNPLRFRIRWIDHYPSIRRAEQFAKILQRGIRKDPRGTFKINLDAFNLCLN